MLSLAIIALYIWPFILHTPVGGLFSVNVFAAISAGISFLTSLIWYIVAPKENSFWPGFIIFILFSITTSILVFTTGGTSSAFIALFMLVAFFAGIFSYAAAIPILAAAGVYVASVYLDGHFSASVVVTVSFSALLPLIAGLIVWHGRADTGDEQGKNQVKKIANQLSEVASKSEVIINAIGDGVVAIDSQGIIQLINPAAQELLGWGKQDALMLNYKSILHLTDALNKDIEPAHDPIQQALNTNQEVRSNNLTIVTKSSKKILSSLVVSPIGEAGSGVIVVFRDITKEKAEEREQAEFISTASHEMRTPVASIEGYLGLALNPNTSKIDDKARDFINKAHESAQHLGRLFQDLLDVSKAEDGRLSNNPKVVDIIPYVHDIVQGLMPKAQEKGLRLTYRPAPDAGSTQKQIAPVYYVNLDNDHIREVTNNLVENAIKYTPQGEVVVDVSGSDDKVVISIKDSGIGIPVEDQKHLFQKFYRVDNEDTRQIGGTGLGLYLCRRLAEAMGGRIWLESEYKKGSTFYLELPRITSTQATELKAQQAQAATQPAPTPFVPPTSPTPPTSTPATPVISAPVTPAPVSPVSTASPAPTSPQMIQDIKPATTVPRGESLSREQIAAHVARLEAMAKSQQATAAARAPAAPPAAPVGQRQA